MADANNMPHIPPSHPKLCFGKRRDNNLEPFGGRQLPRPTAVNGPDFAQNIVVRATRSRVPFTPSAPALIEISRQTFAELLIHDINLSKVLLPEYFDYYSVAMLWLRIVFLKLKNSQPLTVVEMKIIHLDQPSFYIPEPILIQLQHLGNIQTMTKQHLSPHFPPLPSEILKGFPGYYGPIQIGQAANPNIHNLYEEIPCLGVVAEAVRQAISDAPPGPYRSNLDIDEINRVNDNLLGYKPLNFRRNEAKNTAFDVGVHHNHFPCCPESTGFNFEFLISISNILSSTKTFQLTEVDFSKNLTESGAESQIIISRPIVEDGRNNLKSDTRATSLTEEPPSHFGSAIFFGTQLMKQPGPNDDDTTWCCMNVHGGTPKIWIDNRNQRRNLPVQYMQEVFQCLSIGAQSHRIATIRQMVITKRK